MDEQSKKLELFQQRENIKSNKTGMKSTTAKKNTLKGIRSRLNDNRGTDQ